MSHLRLVSSPANPRGTSQSETNRACLDAFRQELDYLSRTLRRLGVQAADVEDLAHEVFLVLHRVWNEYDVSRPLRPYLFGIAYRIASAHHRQTKKHRGYAVVDIEDQAPRPDQALQAKQVRALVLRALGTVPLPRRAVFLMHDIDEVSMREIASVLAIPLFTAYSRLRKARNEFEAAIAALLKTDEP